MSERRPCARVMRFLAESEDGLDRLIKENSIGKEILEIRKNIKKHCLFGAHTAEIVYKEEK